MPSLLSSAQSSYLPTSPVSFLKLQTPSTVVFSQLQLPYFPWPPTFCIVCSHRLEDSIINSFITHPPSIHPPLSMHPFLASACTHAHTHLHAAASPRILQVSAQTPQMRVLPLLDMPTAPVHLRDSLITATIMELFG